VKAFVTFFVFSLPPRLQGSKLHQVYFSYIRVLGDPWCLCAFVAFFVFFFVTKTPKDGCIPKSTIGTKIKLSLMTFGKGTPVS
jgi:hypothetical protein